MVRTTNGEFFPWESVDRSLGVKRHLLPHYHIVAVMSLPPATSNLYLKKIKLKQTHSKVCFKNSGPIKPNLSIPTDLLGAIVYLHFDTTRTCKSGSLPTAQHLHHMPTGTSRWRQKTGKPWEKLIESTTMDDVMSKYQWIKHPLMHLIRVGPNSKCFASKAGMIACYSNVTWKEISFLECHLSVKFVAWDLYAVSQGNCPNCGLDLGWRVPVFWAKEQNLTKNPPKITGE